MSEITIGERQTVQRARHPTLGEGQLVSDNGPCFFLADSGEVERYRQVFCDQAWKADGAEVRLVTNGYPNAKKHRRIVRASDNQAGWLVDWFDDFGTWCHIFEPDDGSEPIKFAANQAWVGGEKDGGDPPKKREHLMTVRGPRLIFVFYREADKAKADSAAKVPARGRVTKKALESGIPFPGPNATRQEIEQWKGAP